MRLLKWCEQLNEGPFLCELCLKTMFRRFAEIGWNPISFINDFRIEVWPDTCSDAIVMTLISRITFNQEERVISGERHVSGMVLTASHPHDLMDCIAAEAELGSYDTVDTMLADIGTDYGTEIRRLHETMEAKAKLGLSSSSFIASITTTSYTDQQVDEWVQHFMSMKGAMTLHAAIKRRCERAPWK